MSLKTVRVLIVDDHAVVREGYRALLEKHEGLKVVGEACDAASAYQSYKATRPDVVIMDISMPGRGGIDAIEHIRRVRRQCARPRLHDAHRGRVRAARFSRRRQRVCHQEQPPRPSGKGGAGRCGRPRWPFVPRSARLSHLIGCRRRKRGWTDFRRASSKFSA